MRDYRALARTGKANETRLKTASEFGNRELGDSAFGRSLVRGFTGRWPVPGESA